MPCVTVPVSPNGVAEGQDVIADLHRAAVAELQIGDLGPLEIELDDGQVGTPIAMNILGIELSAILKMDGNLIGAVDDVEVGQHGAIGIDKEAGTEADLRPGVFGHWKVIEETPKFLRHVGRQWNVSFFAPSPAASWNQC